jgi:hypothetical protein
MKRPSQHWFVLFITLFLPSMMIGISYVDELTMPSLSYWKAFYLGIGVWWVFALMSAMPIRDLNYRAKLARVKYGRWLLVLPVGAIIMNCFTPFESYDERMIVFNSVVVTWCGMIGWILGDWYRWKFDPTERQRELQEYVVYVVERRAEIDKIPDCVIPSGLELLDPEKELLFHDYGPRGVG